eukprot:TRINITY_DN8324_c0_g2_i7.p1 TRINITY_DN8324_c0_g2~~TRINITY_DN8324_c0_g2_i7.p1  ORF type:complete len:119 (+),score=25.52 TRINITY_DN8324_c0_g2_i7:184-540(+)
MYDFWVGGPTPLVQVLINDPNVKIYVTSFYLRARQPLSKAQFPSKITLEGSKDQTHWVELFSDHDPSSWLTFPHASKFFPVTNAGLDWYNNFRVVFPSSATFPLRGFELYGLFSSGNI